MENTRENKARFFAQYWGQEIVIWNLPERATDPLRVGCRVLKEIDINDYLNLKPIQSISDEDAVGFIKIFNTDVNEVSQEQLTEIREKIQEMLTSNTDDAYGTILQLTTGFDYLRCKGYALPYLGLSVEQQIEYGWIKLTE